MALGLHHRGYLVGPLVLLSVDGPSRPRSLSLHDWCFIVRGWLVGVSSLGFSRSPEGVDPRLSHPQKTEDGATRQGFFPWQEARVEQNAHLPSAEGCSRLSSNQRQSHPQKIVRLDKDAFLGRRPMLNRTHVSRQRLKDTKTLFEPGLRSSNQHQSSPQNTVRLDKDAFLGRQPVLNRTHVPPASEGCKDSLRTSTKTLFEPGLRSSNQHQSSPQNTVRLDKDAFLGYTFLTPC